MSSFLCHQVTNTTAYVPPLAKEPVHYNVDQWIEENEKYFLPPVCNKMMHNTQLKVWSTSLITVETLIFFCFFSINYQYYKHMMIP